MSKPYANNSNQIAALKELYSDEIEDPIQDLLEYLGEKKKPRETKSTMKDLFYKKNPFLALISKDDKNE